MKKIVPFLLLMILFAACSPVRELSIETYNPAEITYPERVGKILVVNNAVPQPPGVGYELRIMGMEKDTCRAHADSALWDACRALGKAIVEANYFEDVLLYDYATRTDDLFLTDGKMNVRQVRELCEETGTDAIISFDRLIFDMKKDIDAFADGSMRGTIRVDVNGIARTYLPDRTTPLATIMIADSVLFEEYGNNIEILDMFLPTPEVALRTVGEYIGYTLYSTFVPHWMEERRWYYTGMGSRWKEASAYAAGKKWTEAAEAWNELYEKNTNKKHRAKLASNLALSAEMQGDFRKAYDWAVIASGLFKELEGEDGKRYKLQSVYVTVLEERIRADKKLDIQFGA